MNLYDGNYIDSDKIESIITQENFFCVSEMDNHRDILESIDGIISEYNSSINTKSLLVIRNQIQNKFDILQKNHNNNIEVLIKTKDNYESTSETVKQILDIR